MLPSVSCRTPRRRAPDSSADSSSRPRLRPPHGGSDREVVDRPEPVTIDMAERDAGDLLFPLRGKHHRRLAGHPVAEEAGTGPAGWQGREDRQEESPGMVQLLRRPDRPDRELACGVHAIDRTVAIYVG